MLGGLQLGSFHGFTPNPLLLERWGDERETDEDTGNFDALNRVSSMEVAVETDAQLIQRTRDGDIEAFGHLVEKYQARLFHSLVQWTGRHEDAEDVVQDAFIQAFEKLDSFQGRSAFYTWLYRIAFNLAVSRNRRRRPEQSLESRQEQIGEDLAMDQDSPERQIMRTEQVDQVREALIRLPDDHRAILVLREMEGFCYETIAEILELAPGTVRSRLHRARMHLRDQLKEMLVEPLPD